MKLFSVLKSVALLTSMLTLTGCPPEDPPDPVKGICLGDTSCCEGEWCLVGQECGNGGKCGTVGAGSPGNRNCSCVGSGGGGAGINDWGEADPPIVLAFSSGAPANAVPPPAPGESLTFDYIPPQSILFTTPAALQACPTASTFIEVPMSGSAQLIAERHPDGRPRARLSMVESTLGSSGVQVPCLGHTGLITASYTDFDGYVNINNGNVYLVAEGDLNFGFGFSTHFVTEMGGTVDDDGSLTLSILASDLTQD